MGGDSVHSAAAWALARDQHGVISRAQLRALGYTRHAVQHRIDKGRLHPLWPDVYAVGRPQVEDEGRWVAAVLTCGDGAALSHASAGALWRIFGAPRWPIHVSVPYATRRKRYGIRVHRRRIPFDVTTHRGVPVTTPSQTVIDVAGSLTDAQLERAINDADKLDLVHPAELRTAAGGKRGPGAKRVRDLLDRHTLLLTESELEQRFVPLARRAGYSEPETQVLLNGFLVDFYFAKERVVVETDGGRFHRTPLQQTRDRRRDHAHLAAGLTPLRFTHAQVRYEPSYVIEVLRAVRA